MLSNFRLVVVLSFWFGVENLGFRVQGVDLGLGEPNTL